MADSQKTWWAPVWRGLVADPTAKHYRRLKNALWLLLYFFLHADRASGSLPCHVPTISRMMGISRRTIERWLHRLRAGGYISTVGRGKAARIGISRWKTFPQHRHSGPQLRQNWHRTPPNPVGAGARNGRKRIA